LTHAEPLLAAPGCVQLAELTVPIRMLAAGHRGLLVFAPQKLQREPAPI
jgi:hypothetical protein